jgi:hypothetical protein
MLKNVSGGTVDLKWGRTVFSVDPGSCLDVSVAYGAKDKAFLALEDRFVSKFPGIIVKFTPEAIQEPLPAPAPVIPIKVAVETPKKPIPEPIPEKHHKAGRPAKAHHLKKR